MRHFATPAFWDAFDRLPESVRKAAERSFEPLKREPRHPGLHFKRAGHYWSARVGIAYRALGVEDEGDVVVLDRLARRI